MSQGFWEKLPKPFFVLAPMADVTDASFRRIIARHGKPDVTWTEFVSADGLMLANDEGKKKLLADLIYTEAERPIVAQLFTSKPEMMECAAALARELGFDGVDINMGCPDRSIEKQGAGAAMIKDPENALQVFEAAKRGAGNLPVSIKTRLGYNKDELETWLPRLLSAQPAAITIHARTRKEMSKVDAHWDRIKDAVAIRNSLQGSTLDRTLIIGNGDALDIQDAQKKVQESGCDGVMLGRAIFGNPWLFENLSTVRNKGSEQNHTIYRMISVEEKLKTLVEHTKLFEELLPHKNFAIMKKHYKAYVSGWPACAGRGGAKELRSKLMEASDAREVEHIVDAYMQATE